MDIYMHNGMCIIISFELTPTYEYICSFVTKLIPHDLLMEEILKFVHSFMLQHYRFSNFKAYYIFHTYSITER